LSCGVNLDVVKILNTHVYVWWSLLYVYVLKIKDGLTCEERFSRTWLQRLGRSSFTSTCSRTGKSYAWGRCWRCILVHQTCSLYFGLNLFMELTRH
jgi:hypothetical protein